ncbi:helix-turn-helix domain-containing protein [Streptomyces sp. NPDC005435]|uniref:helix-turn-helix domain-containing protein n=1 Tax=Streptomyces sp. NPDC005435 TaxID=3154464 RepID=UPI003453D0BF
MSPHHPELRDLAMELLSQGRPAREIAQRLRISPQTVYRWRRTRVPRPEAAQTRGRIAELEREILMHRRTIEALKDAMPPKGATRSFLK